MRAKIVLSREGGGGKVDIRPGRHADGGWLVLEFEYDEGGKRTKTSDNQSTSDGQVIEMLKRDPVFWEKFIRLANHPNVRMG